MEIEIFNKMKMRTKAHWETSAPLNLWVRNFDKEKKIDDLKKMKLELDKISSQPVKYKEKIVTEEVKLPEIVEKEKDKENEKEKESAESFLEKWNAFKAKML